MKNRMKYIFQFIALLCLCHTGHAQNEVSQDLQYALKFTVVYSTALPMNSERLKKLDSIISNDKSLAVSKLKKKGFENFNFYKIDHKVVPELTLNYIVAENVNNGGLYRVKGFLNNDFYYVLKTELRIQENTPANFLNKKSLKKFLAANWVEYLDLDCLVENYDKKENWKIPCLSPDNKIIIDDFGEEHY